MSFKQHHTLPSPIYSPLKPGLSTSVVVYNREEIHNSPLTFWTNWRPFSDTDGYGETVTFGKRSVAGGAFCFIRSAEDRVMTSARDAVITMAGVDGWLSRMGTELCGDNAYFGGDNLVLSFALG
ncbi:hypothetical protein ACOMHN_007486 [Nucella lapillus]